MSFKPGNVFTCPINTHRHLWNGEVCSNPLAWNCGNSDESFRDKCSIGQPLCFHLHIFEPNSPRFITPEPTIVKLIEEHSDFFNNQLLFFFGAKYNISKGIQAGYRYSVLYGAYRIKRSYLDDSSWNKHVVIEPYPEDWLLFPQNAVRLPFLEPIEKINYFKSIGSYGALNAVKDALKVAQADHVWTTARQQRLDRFYKLMPEWLAIAQKHLENHSYYTQKSHLFFDQATGSRFNGPFSKLSGLTIQPTLKPGNVAVTTDITLPSGKLEYSLPEEGCTEEIRTKYGDRIVKALEIASSSKKLIILTGSPGVGKSRLALSLINDPERTRSIIVPVASTWRGREDLLGYINPVNSEFIPTELTRFLLKAQSAWQKKDSRIHLVIFEEFNLSQPEHWFSDFLVRLEYEHNQINDSDRTIDLGATYVNVSANKTKHSTITLTPNLMFVATINSDHTVRPLSMRVLDRAALLEVSDSVKDAINRVSLEINQNIVYILQELNYRLESRGVAFSTRTAASLKRAMQNLDESMFMDVLDHILVQGILSKLRLHADDPSDEQLLNDLQSWKLLPECVDLTLCAERIDAWSDAIRDGREVFRA